MLVISPLVLSLLLWMARFAEVAVASRRECARHETAQEILLSVPTVLLWTCALALAAAASERSDASHAPLADASIALLWTGNMWFYLTRGVRHLVTLWCVRAGACAPIRHRPTHSHLDCRAVARVRKSTVRGTAFTILSRPHSCPDPAVPDPALPPSAVQSQKLIPVEFSRLYWTLLMPQV
jgi:hypothetical protein